MPMAKTKKQKKDILNIFFKNLKPLLLPIVLSFLLIILFALTYQVIILDKFYPLTFVGDQNISFLTEEAAIKRLEENFQKRAMGKIYFNYPREVFNIDLATASARVDYSLVNETFKTQHSGIPLEKLIIELQTFISPKKITPNISLKLDNQLDQISKSIAKEPEDAQLLFSETAIQIKAGRDGLKVEKQLLEKSVSDHLLLGKYNINLPVKVVPPKITTEHVKRAKEALELLQKESIKLKFEGNLWVIDTKQLLILLDLTSGENLLLDKNKTYAYISKVANQIDQEVQEGLFEFNPATKRVTAFKASQEGRKLDVEKTYNQITDALLARSPKIINLSVEVVKPKIQTSDVNSLGIKELIGRGISHFAGSIPNRIYNIGLAASRINGILIPPGEVFSFNEKVGDISAQSGYKSAYVIKSGRTVLDDGGGVCQDSTTLFRAVLNAGLPVVQRVAHAYRVGYYEQSFPPGLDATVWAPSVDFKFKNDTPAHILIQAYTTGNTLYVDLYGTSDGRISQISKSSVTDQTPPPPELRQDDPTLPKGTVKQVDFAAWGAKVSFSRTVTRGSETLINENFLSNYKPWQAVYLVGTKEN